MKGQKRKTWIHFLNRSPIKNVGDKPRGGQEGAREEDTESSFRQRMTEPLQSPT